MPPPHSPLPSTAAHTLAPSNPLPTPAALPSPAQPPTHSPPAPPSLEDTKTTSLKSKIAALTAQIASTQAQIDAMVPQLKNPHAAHTVQTHITLLHAYNEIRDIGQGLLGMIAENRGVRVRDVYGEFGVGEGD